MAKAIKKNRVLPLIAALLLLGVGMFMGGLIASPSFRSEVSTKVSQSAPVQYLIDYFADKKVVLTLQLPQRTRHPAE